MAQIDALTIVNRACALIGDAPLQAFGTDVAGGDPAQLIFEAQLEFCLGLYPWTFARETKALTSTDQYQPSAGYRYAFQIPGNPPQEVLRLMASADPDDVITEYELEANGALSCDASAVWAQLKRNTGDISPATFSATFTAALTSAVASDLAMARAHDKSLKAQFRQEAFGSPSENFRGGLMGAAIRADSAGAPVRRLRTGGPLLDAWRS